MDSKKPLSTMQCIDEQLAGIFLGIYDEKENLIHIQ
jgi:hypothetical protein